MNTIKLYLDNSGQIKNVHKDFNLYQGAVGVVGIEIYVPREMLNSPMVTDDDTVIGSNAVTIYATAISETGKRITSPAEQCHFLRKENKDNIEYWVFTRASGLPKEFLRYAGDLTICASIFKLYTADDGSTKLESRGKMQMFKTTVLPNPDGNLDPEYAASELTAMYDLLNTTILNQDAIYGADGKTGTVYKTPAINLSTLNQNKADRAETVLKYDLRQPLPKNLTYNKNGYKTAGVLFMNETHTVPTDVAPAINLETVTGALLVANIVPDIEQPNLIAWQNEIFYHEKGNSARKIKLDISQFKETGVITTLQVGDWKVQNYAWFDTTSQQIIVLGDRVQNLENDYVSKELNVLPLEEKEEFAVTETGALQQTTTKRDIRTGEKSTVTITPIPVTDEQARLIQPPEIQSLRQLLQWQATLSGEALNYVVNLSDLPTGDTQSEAVQSFLTGKYKEVTETPDTILDQVTLHDEVLGIAFRWYENTQTWVLSQGSIAGKATNNLYDKDGNMIEQGNVGGTVGSNKEGGIFYEANGEGSLIGYDALKEQVTNNTQAIADETANRRTVMETETAARTAADAAINAIIGVLSELTTSQKDTLVNALNSLKAETNANAATINTVNDVAVKITGDQDIAGTKNFTDGTIKIGGVEIHYDADTEKMTIGNEPVLTEPVLSGLVNLTNPQTITGEKTFTTINATSLNVSDINLVTE